MLFTNLLVPDLLGRRTSEVRLPLALSITSHLYAAARTGAQQTQQEL